MLYLYMIGTTCRRTPTVCRYPTDGCKYCAALINGIGIMGLLVIRRGMRRQNVKMSDSVEARRQLLKPGANRVMGTDSDAHFLGLINRYVRSP